MIVKSLSHAIQVRGGSKDDENMKDLMRATPDIEGTGILAFRPPDLHFELGIMWNQPLRFGGK
jgi:hypothetical protein